MSNAALQGGAGGSATVTLLAPSTSTNRTLTLPDVTGTLSVIDGAQTYTSPQRGSVTTDNDLSFDMSVGNNFKCTPTGNGTLTFTNITAGQSGFIWFVNGSNYTISAAATTKINTGDLSTISLSGTYILSYFSDGTNVAVAVSRNLTA